MIVIELRSRFFSCQHWYVLRSHANGKVLATSETYYNKSNRDRAARELQLSLNKQKVIQVVETTSKGQQ